MMTKTTVVSLFALSLLVLTGVGYAAFTSTITVTGTASAGTLALSFTTPATTGTSTPTGAGSCYFSGTGSTTTLTVTNLAPSDTCYATITVYIGGTLPATSLATTITGAVPPLCWGSTPANCFVVTDTLGLNSGTGTDGAWSGTLASGTSFVYGVTVGLSAFSTTQSLSGSFTIYLTGSVGT
jgi:hypothetical protein